MCYIITDTITLTLETKGITLTNIVSNFSTSSVLEAGTRACVPNSANQRFYRQYYKQYICIHSTFYVLQVQESRPAVADAGKCIYINVYLYSGRCPQIKLDRLPQYGYLMPFKFKQTVFLLRFHKLILWFGNLECKEQF